MSAVRRMVVLGATGSIGESACKVARSLPDRVRLVGLSANSNRAALEQLAREFQPEAVGLVSAPDRMPDRIGASRVCTGTDGLIELATLPAADLVLVAIVGTAGLRPALAAIEAGKDLAVASKEILVMAGGIVMAAARRKGVRVIPVDSEHNAIFQCIEGREPNEVRRLLLTCSGGPFRQTPASEFGAVTPEMALRHPTWRMGRKISVDSATLFNKGLEMIEAHWLFDTPMDQIEVVIHPQSIVHSMVEFVDGSVLAQMSCSDMAFPIQYAVTYPGRIAGALPPLDFGALGSLEFSTPREECFPALRLAREAGARGSTLPAILNAANEIAVEAFLAGRIRFPEIWEVVARVMGGSEVPPTASLEQILRADRQAREMAASLVG